MRVVLLPAVCLAAAGCGPSAQELREQTLSTLNTEADKWDGKNDLVPAATDAYGRAVTARVEKGTINYTLEVRSNGPDGLPKNSDDIVVTRSKPHGETTISEVIGKGAETVSAGIGSGLVKGVAKGLGIGGEKDKDKAKEK
jgi:hypothetical protein